MVHSALSIRLQNMAIQIDSACDCLPLASNLIALVNIFGKCVCRCFKSSSSIHNHRYVAHLEHKPLWRCLFLLCVPGLSNIALAIYDPMKPYQQTQEIPQLSIKPEEPPRDAKKADDKVQGIQKLVKEWYDQAIQDVKRFTKQFQALMVSNGQSGHSQARQLRRHHRLWSGFKCCYFNRECLKAILEFNYKQTMAAAQEPVTDLHKDPLFINRQQRLSKLESELFDIRRNSYKNLIAPFSPIQLLAEAKEWLLLSFPGTERPAKKKSVNKLTLQQLLPELKKQCTTLAAEPIRVIEMQALLSRIDC
jgi:hypothetical protein